MRRLLAACLVVALPCAAQACSGTVRRDVEGSVDFEGVHEGEVLIGLDHAVRDASSGKMMVCGDHCYPAIVRDGAVPGGLAETVELHDCAVGEMDTDEGGIETYPLTNAVEPGQ